MNYCRINNTIIHEIGHIILGHEQESNLAEAEVKFFAKYLLAPPILIHSIGLKSAEEVKIIFKISYEASNIAWEYYNKWLRNNKPYTAYEKIMLEQFKPDIEKHKHDNENNFNKTHFMDEMGRCWGIMDLVDI